MDKDKDELQKKKAVQKNLKDALLEKLQNADSDDIYDIMMILKRL